MVTIAMWFRRMAARLAVPAAAVLLLTGCNGGNGSSPDQSGGAFPNFPAPGAADVPQNAYPNTPPTLQQLLRGRYIVTSADCVDCHSLPGPDPTNPFYMSGFVSNPTLNPEEIGFFPEGPIQAFSSDLTPDVTGISNHSPLELWNGLTTGQHHHNFGLLCPPMEWNHYRNMTPDDKWSIVAYLKSLAPVNNPVSFAETGAGAPLGPTNCNYVPVDTSPLPDYPAGNEVPVTNTSGPGVPNGPATLAQVLNGRYLVTCVSLCSSCHNRDVDNPNDPNWLAGYLNSPTLNPENIGTFAIGPDTVDAANITPDPTGLGSGGSGGGAWTAQDIFNVLRDGHGPDGQFVFPPMPWEDFRNYTDDDLWSIVAYLQNIKPVANVVPAPGGPVPVDAFYMTLPPFPLPPYPAIQEINASDPASDQ